MMQVEANEGRQAVRDAKLETQRAQQACVEERDAARYESFCSTLIAGLEILVVCKKSLCVVLAARFQDLPLLRLTCRSSF